MKTKKCITTVLQQQQNKRGEQVTVGETGAERKPVELYDPNLHAKHLGINLSSHHGVALR